MVLKRVPDTPFAGGHELIVVPATKEGSLPTGVPESIARAVARAIERGTFRGDAGDKLSLVGTNPGDESEVLVVGIGESDTFDTEGCRAFAGRAVRAAERIRRDSLAVCIPEVGAASNMDRARAVAEGVVLASWRFRELKTDGDDDVAPAVTAAHLWLGASDPTTDPGIDAAIELGRAVALGENLTRTLQIQPGNLMTPTILADQAQAMAAEVGIECEIWGPQRLEQERMHALLSVSHGSDEEPRFIILRYDGGANGAAPLALVGKGLTFDTGGVSLKPPKGMEGPAR